MTRKNYVQLAVLPLFALLALGSSSPKKDDKKSSTTTTTSASISNSVTVGDAQWTILDVVNRGSTMKGSDSWDKEATTTGTFIQVHFKVANTSTKEGSIGGIPKLVAADGREFGTVEMQSSYLPKNANGVFLDKIQPSMSKEFYEIFEIPAGVTQVSFKAHDFGLFASDKKLSLGTLPPAPPPPPATAAPASTAKAAPAPKAKAAKKKK